MKNIRATSQFSEREPRRSMNGKLANERGPNQFDIPPGIPSAADRIAFGYRPEGYTDGEWVIHLLTIARQGYTLTQNEASIVIGMSAQRAQQIERSALAKFREALGSLEAIGLDELPDDVDLTPHENPGDIESVYSPGAVRPEKRARKR